MQPYSIQEEKTMKNLKKIAGILALLTAVVMLLTACSDGGNIEGTWKMTSVTGSGEEFDAFRQIMAMGEVTMTFKSGKYTLSLTYGGVTQEITNGTYKTSGDTVTLDKDDANYKVDGDTLTIKDDYGTMKLVKK
jgi:hypothetical protein